MFTLTYTFMYDFNSVPLSVIFENWKKYTKYTKFELKFDMSPNFFLVFGMCHKMY